MAGLDPAIYQDREAAFRWEMDARVKPAHDERAQAYASPSVSNSAAAMASWVDLPAQTTNWKAGK